ncbi:MAG: OmpA family protein, partial [Bacteroidales bacterium]|nr:OmpA family protein [Bacteroidales bacterium]
AAADAEAARLAAERAAAERAAQEAAARARARAITENVLFVIDQWKIRPSEQEKIDRVVNIMKQYPEAVVTISAYADKQTGNPRWNMTLSQHRAEVVAEALKAAGIAANRITTEYFGDTVNPFATAPENRVSVLVTK